MLELDLVHDMDGGTGGPEPFAGFLAAYSNSCKGMPATVELPSGTEMVMPGDNLKFTVQLIAPIAMDEGLKFAIREGGRTVGAGVVSKIVE